MKYTILHISDIHKRKDVSYDALLQSLKSDYDRYSKYDHILCPTFIVVSGDLVQGAYTEEEIEQQYNEVEYFLGELCNLFLDGDRNRIIIVPGNHDVFRPTSKEAMAASVMDSKSCIQEYFVPGSKIRWNWKELAFYEINDFNKYNTRFDKFIAFYNRFYDGIRVFPNNPEKEAFVYVNDDYRVCFTGFNSCCELDHLKDTGKIAEEALMSVWSTLNKSYNDGYLNIAVWHHHLYGKPIETNYMDRSILVDFLSNNINIGLFGHQHFSQIAEEYSDLLLKKGDNIQKLLLVSSGTIFGGNKELPPGCRRQYNLIEVTHNNGEAIIDINIREDAKMEAASKIPYWRTKPLNNDTNKITYCIPLKELSIEEKLLAIDIVAQSNSDYKKAYEKVLEIEKDSKRNLTKWKKLYLRKVVDPKYILDADIEIDSIEDAIMMIDAAINTGENKYMKKVLEDERIKKFVSDNNVNLFFSELDKKYNSNIG